MTFTSLSFVSRSFLAPRLSLQTSTCNALENHSPMIYRVPRRLSLLCNYGIAPPIDTENRFPFCGSRLSWTSTLAFPNEALFTCTFISKDPYLVRNTIVNRAIYEATESLRWRCGDENRPPGFHISKEYVRFALHGPTVAWSCDPRNVRCSDTELLAMWKMLLGCRYDIYLVVD